VNNQPFPEDAFININDTMYKKCRYFSSPDIRKMVVRSSIEEVSRTPFFSGGKRSRNSPFNQLPNDKLQGGVMTMKKSYPIIRFLVVLMMIAAFVACASTPKQSSTGEVVDDSVITTKIKTQLANDEFLKSFQISVETRKGIVELSGFVDTQKAKDRAGQIARGVEGVKSVQNALILK
jgi:hypothetical protein